MPVRAGCASHTLVVSQEKAHAAVEAVQTIRKAIVAERKAMKKEYVWDRVHLNFSLHRQPLTLSCSLETESGGG